MTGRISSSTAHRRRTRYVEASVLFGHVQRPAVLKVRLALAHHRRAQIWPRRLRARGPRRVEVARRCRNPRRARRTRGPQRPGRDRPGADVGASRICAAGVQAPARAVVTGVASVVALVPDLLFGSSVVSQLGAAGHEAALISSLDQFQPGTAEVLLGRLDRGRPRARRAARGRRPRWRAPFSRLRARRGGRAWTRRGGWFRPRRASLALHARGRGAGLRLAG